MSSALHWNVWLDVAGHLKIFSYISSSLQKILSRFYQIKILGIAICNKHKVKDERLKNIEQKQKNMAQFHNDGTEYLQSSHILLWSKSNQSYNTNTQIDK